MAKKKGVCLRLFMNYETPWLKNKSTGIVEIYDGTSWVSLIDPSSMTMNTYDLDSGEGSGRNQDGEMLRDRVAVKEKIELKFPPMYRSDYHKLLSLIKDTFFQCRYFSDLQGKQRTVTMYVGDRKCSVYYMYDAKNEAQAIVQDVSFNFIEK